MNDDEIDLPVSVRLTLCSSRINDALAKSSMSNQRNR